MRAGAPEGAGLASAPSSTAQEEPEATRAAEAREPGEAVPIATPPGPRLVSLDVFRGVTIAGMLLVNNPGTWSAIYPPLRHAEWHGWTPTDLIFPFFLYIVGVAMVFSLVRRMEEGASRARLFSKAGRRALILVALGLALHGFPGYDFSEMRFPGVLQRIGVAYLAASAIVLTTKRARGQAFWAAGLLLLYWGLMTLVPVPGYATGDLSPDGSLAAYLDRMILGTEHMWSQSRTWDPEGILSTIPAVGTVLLGVLTGHWLRGARPPVEKTVWLFVAGNAALLVGIVWGWVFPINKNLWTSSYVVFTGGMALHFLGVCYWLVDVKRWRRWALPFVVYGTNAIAAFVLSTFGAILIGRVIRVPAAEGTVPLKAWIFQNLFAPWAEPVNASLAFAAAYVLLWLGVMWVFYRKRIFIKV